MKKILTVFLALLLVFCFTLPAFAEKSPTPTAKYSVVVISHADGSSEGKTVTYSVDDGNTIKIDVPSSSLKFSNARIYKSDGSVAVEGKDYEIVEGSLDGASVTVKPHTDIVVEQFFDGAEYTDTFVIKIEQNGVLRSFFIRKGEIISITASANDFSSFKIYLGDGVTPAVEGKDYTLNNSKLTDKTINISPNAVILIKEVTKSDKESSAPTGVPIFAISLVIIVAGVICFVAKKRAFN